VESVPDLGGAGPDRARLGTGNTDARPVGTPFVTQILVQRLRKSRAASGCPDGRQERLVRSVRPEARRNRANYGPPGLSTKFRPRRARLRGRLRTVVRPYSHCAGHLASAALSFVATKRIGIHIARDDQGSRTSARGVMRDGNAFTSSSEKPSTGFSTVPWTVARKDGPGRFRR